MVALCRVDTITKIHYQFLGQHGASYLVDDGNAADLDLRKEYHVSFTRKMFTEQQDIFSDSSFGSGNEYKPDSFPWILRYIIH